MICPCCHQPSDMPAAGAQCPLCGFDARPVQKRVLTLYVVGFAFFMSLLLYAGLVYFFDTQGTIPYKAEATQGSLPYVLLLVAVLVFGIAWKIGQRLETATATQAVFVLHVVKLALFESIAIMGMLMYFVSGSLKLFAGFLLLSAVGFVIAGTQLPAVVRRMEELAVGEAEAKSRDH
ncbi:MAG: hypothetical protein ABFE07_19770 [Armatimonadia bacterium]